MGPRMKKAEMDRTSPALCFRTEFFCLNPAGESLLLPNDDTKCQCSECKESSSYSWLIQYSHHYLLNI